MNMTSESLLGPSEYYSRSKNLAVSNISLRYRLVFRFILVYRIYNRSDVVLTSKSEIIISLLSDLHDSIYFFRIPVHAHTILIET